MIRLHIPACICTFIIINNIIHKQIVVGGQSIKMLDLTSLRSMFGLVDQEPVLFDTTIKENILLGKQGTKADEDQEEVKEQELYVEAAKNANAHGFVSKMPEGYDTSVGKRCTIKYVAVNYEQVGYVCVQKI